MKIISEIDFSEVQIVFFDFDGVFTDNYVTIDENGIEQVKCYRSDGLGLNMLRKIKVPMYIISSETNNVVVERSRKLNVPCAHGVLDKSKIARDLCLENGTTLDRAVFIGNDINDIEVLKVVGFPIGVSDSFSCLDDFIVAKTRNPGGQGAVRELCEMIYVSITKADDNV